ncbi:MAG: HAMP domain-containing histidine kinase [Betaproteobacteria bacterium]|nr:HAMP domain-containing histidine kinase [Betaproteobacteria bacterium]
MSSDPKQHKTVPELENRIAALEKTNQALMDRVERAMDAIGSDSYSLFVHNLTLQRHVEEQTQELQESNDQLQDALADLKSATEQMVQTEKLAALGGLVAGVAHEINTPLGISVTAASHLEETVRMLSRAFEAGTMKKSDFTNFISDSQETVRIILSNLSRAANLIQSFKKIAVDQSNETWQTIELEPYLKDIIISLTPKLRKIRAQTNILCPETLKINTMPGALSQILTNLITNSVLHGFSEGKSGNITITVKTKRNSTVLIYTDNGKGIPRENLPKIFEPFFTTRRAQGGSGLGMHLVYNIVTSSLGGTITADSTPGEGVTFTITLPNSVRE